jgi:uncharacterized membrane protein YphA (DoxX/SURF4 family)
MEMQTAFDVVLGGFMLLASFFMKIFWDMLQDTRKEMYDAEQPMCAGMITAWTWMS